MHERLDKSYCQTMKCFVNNFLVLLLGMAAVSCESLDKYSFESFQPSAAQQKLTVRSDLLALQYADSVASLLERRATGARITREASDSTLMVAGALAAASEPLGIAAKTVSQGAVGVIILRELQGIFNSRGRSEAFADAAYLVRQAQGEYRQYNPNASSDQLTENGAILISRVDAALHAARKTLNGRMPALVDLQQATQRMTKAGAERRSSGTPQTIFTAAGDKPDLGGVTPEQLQAAVDRGVQEMKREQQRLVKEQTVQPLTPTEAQGKIDSMTAELSGTTKLERVRQLHQDILGEVQGTDMDVIKEALNEHLRSTRNELMAQDDAVSTKARENLKKSLQAFGR